MNLRFRHVPDGSGRGSTSERDELLVEPLTVTAIGFFDLDVIREERRAFQWPRLLLAAGRTGLGPLAGEPSTKSAECHSHSHCGSLSSDPINRVVCLILFIGPVVVPSAVAMVLYAPVGRAV